MRTRFLLLLATLSSLTATVPSALAQANLPIYTDNLVNAFQDWSWAARNMANPSPVHSGSRSISVTATAWAGLTFQHPDFNTSPYTNFSFWAHGGTGGGQRLQVYAEYGASGRGPTYPLPTALTAGTWTQYVIPLSTLGVANAPNLNRITIQLTASGTVNTFYVDDIQLGAAPAPALVHLAVNASNTLRSADARWFGLNTAVWDSFLDTVSTSNALKELGCLSLRFPGGSLSDQYHWATGTTVTNTWKWSTSFSNFIHVATNAGVEVFITVNYGSGTSNEAAGWVKSANITNQCGFKYWEIGNECYGTWETDSNNVPHDPYTYASRAAGYMALMRAADPTIKIGVVAVPGEDSSINNSNHPAFNPRTGQTHYGWTPVMLTTLKNLGATPDFLIHHVYPQYTPSGGTPPANDSDPLVLQASANWAIDAAELRQEINDYFGTGGTNIELVCTENNSDAGALGRQLTSVVNGLYVADSMSQLMKTEFNAYTFWDLRNGTNNDGSFDPTLYGWRTYGDEGLMFSISGSAPLYVYPVYYGFKLMQHFARPGDTILNATSDYLLLSAYASRKPNGSLALLVINKDSLSNFTAQISLSNFIPSGTALTRSYGIPQDEAVRTNGPAALKDLQTNSVSAGTTITNSFPPYSLTLFTFQPIAPQVQALGASASQFVFQLQGSPGTPYVIQTSTDLTGGTWTPVSTNTLTGGSLNLTNSIPAGGLQQYWRAVWQP